jgi:NADPH:quinone reductase
MKAVQANRDGDNYQLAFKNDIETPEPSESELLIRVVASQINPSDVMNVSGKFPQSTFPRIPGRDFAGIVVKSKSSKFPEGSKVYGTSGPQISFTQNGSHAEYMVVPENGAAMKPEKLSFIQAATIGVPFTTARLALQRAQAKAGETVLIIGANGAVGSAASQIAKKMGCKVLDAARRDGSAVDLRKDPGMESVSALTSGKGVDVCLDTVGSVDLRKSALRALGSGGRLALIIVQGDPEVSVDLRTLYRKNQSIVGCNSLLIPMWEMAASLQEMGPWFDSNNLEAPDEGGYSKIGIEELKGAYEDLMSGKAKGKKFVLEFPE